MGVIVDILKAIMSIKFYKTVVQRKMSRALVHLLIISLLYTLAFTIFANIHILGQANMFMDWASENFPAIMLQGRELSTDAQEPFFTSYEEFDLNFVFSTKQEFTDIDALAPSTVIVESTRLLFYGNDTAFEEYDLASMNELPENINVTLNSEGWLRIKAVANKWFSPVIFIFVFIFALTGYFIAAVVYALMGMFINMFVKAKLNFGAMLRIAIYALTLLNLIVIIGLFVPFILFPYRGVVLIIVTIIYIILGLTVNKSEIQSEA